MLPATRSKCLVTAGTLITSVGLFFMIFWTAIFTSRIKNMMILRNGSMSFEIWRDIPIPIYLECFLFNITNVDDILAKKNVTVKVQQMGPYVFREIHKKANVTWNDNSTVTFKNLRWWYFEPTMSNGSLSDMVTSINPIIATVAYIMRYQNIFIKTIVDMILRNSHRNMFVTANASCWLFDGMQEPVLDLANRLPYVPYKIPFDKFGWLYTRNGSTEVDGLIVMNTGATDFHKLGMMEMWQHSNQTYFRDECGHVKGSNGELWALKQDQEEIQIFVPDFCTYMSLPKAGPIAVRGVPGVEFAGNDSMFDNGHRYPALGCYCDENSGNDCMPAGVLNVSTCHFNAPAFVTLPHFRGVDSYYADKIEGLQPNESHNFRMSIEPITGMPLHVSAQVQVNALVRHVPGFSINNQLPDPDVLVPMFWFREDISVDENYANFAKMALDVKHGMPYAFCTAMIIGVLMLLSGIWCYRETICPMKKRGEIDMLAKETFLKHKQQR